jgi:multidrug efflux pump subunit AcrB
MNISAWSIRNPVPAILMFVLLTACGLLAFSQLAVQKFPEMDMPTIKISATFEGAAPDQLETEVARKIEDNLTGLTGLDHITTTITDGSVSISVSFELEKDSEVALNEVRNAVDSTTDLPSDMQTPTVSKVTVQGSVLVAYAIRSTRLNETELSWLVDNDFKKALLSVHGVGEVNRVGGIDREVHIDLDPVVMTSLGVTASDVSTQLKSVQVNSSGGRGEVGGQRQTIRTLGAVSSIEELSALPIPLANGNQVRLDQIAKVSDSFSDRSSLAYFDGQPIVAMQIKRSSGYSDIGVADGIEKVVSAFAAAHSEVSIEQAYTTVTPAVDNYETSMEMLYEGAILAVVVVFIFLRNWRATLLSATALPLSIIPTFLAMYFFGYSLNTVSLLSLSLVVGILVDDAIVEVENISRHLRMGKSPYDAAMEAADEIGLAVIATTFTLVAVFLPTAFMSGIPGLIFRQFGITASVAVLASLAVARFLTPMLAAYTMKPTSHVETTGWIMRGYLRLVSACLRHCYLTISAATAFFIGSLGVITMLQTSFMGASDDGQTKVTLTLPPGSRIEQTDDVAMQAAALLEGLQDVKRVFVAVGSASAGGFDSSATSDVKSATLTVDFKPISERSSTQSEVEDKVRHALRQLAGVRVEVGNGGNGTTLQLTLAGDDANVLNATAEKVEKELRGIPGIGSVTSSAALQAPEIQIIPDPIRAAELGITSEAIARAVRVATNGDYSASMSKLNLPQRQIAIRVRFASPVRTDLRELSALRVAGTSGTVALNTVANITIGSGSSQINRIDRSRNVTLTVELNGRALGEVNTAALALPTLSQLPSGIHLVEQGELQRMTELFTSFGTAMAIGVFCVYAVLVLLFHDFLQPITILMALPLSLGGALVPLVLTGASFSMSAIIGLLMLMGIVTKNSILLVEYAITARRQGMERFDALVNASSKRARPIVMTTIAMGAGMLPAALSLSGSDPSFRQPMAIVVIGGLVTSTLLSLVVIPVVFTFVDDFLGLITGRSRSKAS